MSFLKRNSGDSYEAQTQGSTNRDIADGLGRRVLWRADSFGALSDVHPVRPPADWRTASTDAVHDALSELVRMEHTMKNRNYRKGCSHKLKWPTTSGVELPHADAGNEQHAGAEAAEAAPSSSPLASTRELLKAQLQIRDLGFSLLRGVPPTEEGTEAVCGRLSGGRLQRTVYGEGMWRTEVRPREDQDAPSVSKSDPESAFNDTAYTSAPLRSHTDGNYWTEPPRLQAFHCVKADADGGGLSVLVDGVAAAERLRAASPESFAFFAGVRLPFGHVDGETRYLARHAPIKLRTWEVAPGREALAPVESVHYNNDDRWTPLAGPEHVRAATGCDEWTGHGRSRSDPLFWRCAPSWAVVEGFYRHIASWLACVRDPGMEVWLRLAPGDVLVFDNWRVFHGRSGFDNRSGRVLSGCYVQDDEFRSATRVAARSLAVALRGEGGSVVPGERLDGGDEPAVVATWDDLPRGFVEAEDVCKGWAGARNEPQWME